MIKLFSKIKNKYKYFTIAVDVQESEPKARVCWVIKEVNDELLVDCPSLNLKKVYLYKPEGKDNYFFKSQQSIVESPEFDKAIRELAKEAHAAKSGSAGLNAL